RVEGTFDPLAIRLRDDKRRKKLHGEVCVTSELDEDLVVLEQRDRDELAKQAGADCFEQGPCRLELERAGRPEFNADHKTFSTHGMHEFIALCHGFEGGEKPCACLCGLM